MVSIQLPKLESNKRLNKFLEQARVVHEDFYDYSFVFYTNNFTPVKIICPIHGVFNQRPSKHIHSKQGCPRCRGKCERKTKEEFIRQANIVHNYLYNYDNVVYLNNKTKVSVTCKKHNDFLVRPDNHLNLRSGCPICARESTTKVSKHQLELYNYLIQLGYDVQLSYRPNWLEGKELDIYIPSKQLAIEYNGLSYHHSSIGINSFYDDTYVSSTYHLDKYNVCLANNVNLIHTFDFEDLDRWKQDIKDYLSGELTTIRFENRLRYIKHYTKELVCYGISQIF